MYKTKVLYKLSPIRFTSILPSERIDTKMSSRFLYSCIRHKTFSFNGHNAKWPLKAVVESRVVFGTWNVHSSYCLNVWERRRLDEKRKLSQWHVLQNKSLGGKLINSSPSYVQPYLQLMRIDKPTGTFLLLWPSLWSISLATESGCWPSLSYLGIFTLGAFLMRGAGCTINDMWDRDIDSKVERTQDRPLASGRLDWTDALGFLALQLGCAAVVLLQLDWTSILLGCSSMGLVITYPLAKRFTNWPQLVLGLTFNWGVILGWSAAHGSSDWHLVLPLYAAAVSWTLIYDTIYAHQDRLDDSKTGVKSTALLFGDSSKKWLSIFSCSMLANLLVTGLANQQTWPFFVSTALVGLHLATQITTLDINNKENCARRFKSNATLGGILFVGIILGSLMKEKIL